jgi:hypothetical protein
MQICLPRLRPLVVATALSVASIGAFAQASAPAGANTPGIDQRQANQEQRIDQGVAKGSLTRREARRLQHEQGAIDKAENKAKADGTVTRAERRRLHRLQDRASRDIRRQKHDAQAPRRGASAPGR